MKRYQYTLVAIASLFLSGYLRITEELYLEAEGSGCYETRIDASDLFDRESLGARHNDIKYK